MPVHATYCVLEINAMRSLDSWNGNGIVRAWLACAMMCPSGTRSATQSAPFSNPPLPRSYMYHASPVVASAREQHVFGEPAARAGPTGAVVGAKSFSLGGAAARRRQDWTAPRQPWGVLGMDGMALICGC